MIYKAMVLLTFVISIVLYYSNPNQFISDNSLFYPVVAENIWTTGVSTFNGYIETNGYQPLWMFFSVIAIAISSFFSWDPLIVIGVIYHIFLAGAIVVVFKMAERWPFFSAPVVAVTFIFMFIANGVLHNMESAMALFFVLSTLYYALKMEVPSKKQYFLLGLLLGLTVLSRLDLVFFALILTVYLLFRHKKEMGVHPRSVLFLLLGTIVIVLPYLIRNSILFDHILPMSQQLSNGFQTLAYAWENIYPYGAVSLVIAFIEWAIAWTAKSREARAIILIMSISTIFQITYVAFFQHPQSWYFITGFINFAVIIGYLLKKINREWLTRVVFVLLIIATVGSAYLKTVSNYALSAHILRLKEDKVGKADLFLSEKSEKLKYAEDVKKILPEKTTVLVGHTPGALAYYAKLRVFAANGLSNGLIQNSRYDSALVQNGIEAMIEKYEIKYLIVPLSNGPVLWYRHIGFNVINNEYQVMIYTKSSVNSCALLQYQNKKDISKVRLGFAGIFPIQDVTECSSEMKNYEKSRFYFTTIGHL